MMMMVNKKKKRKKKRKRKRKKIKLMKLDRNDFGLDKERKGNLMMTEMM